MQSDIPLEEEGIEDEIESPMKKLKEANNINVNKSQSILKEYESDYFELEVL